MKQIKYIIHKIIGENNFEKLRNLKIYFTQFPLLLKNFYIDLLLYYKHSNIFKKDNLNKIEGLIILKYHSIEKGLLHNKMRFKFGKENVVSLGNLLKRKDILLNKHKTQIAAAYAAMCNYYEFHNVNKIDISNYFSKKDYEFFKNNSVLNLRSIKKQEKDNYFQNTEKSFNQFSKSRASIRDFTGEKIGINVLKDVIELTKNAPSVCNRQSVKVYLVEDQFKIEKILTIQGGLRGYSDDITQLLVVVSDRNYFYSVGERNQLYIDGGIFLMNLLYSLHYYKIGACPAHWGLNSDIDKKINKLINLSDSEKVISLVVIGIPKNNFNTCTSLRRSNDEILKIVN